MISYVIRRIAQGLGFILLMWFVMYTVLVMFMPVFPDPNETFTLAEAAKSVKEDQAQGQPVKYWFILNAGDPVLAAGEAWPLNFFLWLFNPNPPTSSIKSDPSRLDTIQQETPHGIDLRLGPLHLTGAGALTGNFGRSAQVGHNLKILDMIGDAWGRTALLVALALLVTVVVSIPLGILAAVRYRTSVDHALTFFSFFGFSLPPFSLGAILILLFAVGPSLLRINLGWNWLPYLPPGDVTSLGKEEDFIDRMQHLVLPVATLAIPQIAFLSRHVRFSMLEIMNLDYIRTAWAKGAPTRKVIWRHALRNALIPVITSIGLMIPLLLTSAIMVESVFAYHGLGQMFFQALGLAPPIAADAEPGAVGRMDFALTLALIFLLVLVVGLSNILADMFYMVADPRIDYGAKKS